MLNEDIKEEEKYHMNNDQLQKLKYFLKVNIEGHLSALQDGMAEDPHLQLAQIGETLAKTSPRQDPELFYELVNQKDHLKFKIQTEKFLWGNESIKSLIAKFELMKVLNSLTKENTNATTQTRETPKPDTERQIQSETKIDEPEVNSDDNQGTESSTETTTKSKRKTATKSKKSSSDGRKKTTGKRTTKKKDAESTNEDKGDK